MSSYIPGYDTVKEPTRTDLGFKSKIICRRFHPMASQPSSINQWEPFRRISIVERIGRDADIPGELNEFRLGLGFAVQAPYAVEIIGTPELLNQGYFLPHPVLIDPTNREEIHVTLFKLPGNGADLQLPASNVLGVRMIHNDYTDWPMDSKGTAETTSYASQISQLDRMFGGGQINRTSNPSNRGTSKQNFQFA